jgi:hypothetical protein
MFSNIQRHNSFNFNLFGYQYLLDQWLIHEYFNLFGNVFSIAFDKVRSLDKYLFDHLTDDLLLNF